MKLLFNIIVPLLLLSSCSVVKTFEDKDNKSQPISVYTGIFQTSKSSIASKIIITDDPQITFSSINDFAITSSTLSQELDKLGNPFLKASGGIKASSFYSNKGNPGKDYIEEFKDGDGNLRTRIYENGLLVSYKINGIEQ